MAQVPVTNVASPDFRDGAATGAATVARRARTLMSWGVRVDDRLIDALAQGVREQFGGFVHVSECED